jgi:DNA modification methylase
MAHRQLEVSYRKAAELKPYERNARTHSAEQLKQIAESIRRFGFTNPILVDPSGGVIAGHGRLAAAALLKMEDVPTIVLVGLSEVERKALVLADNRIAESSGWDADLLSLELAELEGVGLDLAITGFSDRELGELIKRDARGGQTHPDDAPAAPVQARSLQGDVWRCGDHLVACGDSTMPDTYERLLGTSQVSTVWTDPPYNVAYGDKVEALQKRAGSQILNDDMSAEQFLAFLQACFGELFHALVPGGCIYVAHADTEGLNFRLAFQRAGFKLSSCLVWRKDALVLGRSDYQWIHEPILYGWKPGKGHRWYGGRKETTVIEEAKPRRNDLHPTMKPVALIERLLRHVTRAGDTVLDPFGGSGSTLMACERLGLSARLIELDPKYCDVIVARWQDYTGRSAVRVVDGVEFNHARTQTDADGVKADPR